MLITRTSMLTNITRTREINITEEQYNNWIETNSKIQYAFPHLSESDREFILSGITDEEWDEAFDEDDSFDTDLYDTNEEAPPF